MTNNIQKEIAETTDSLTEEMRHGDAWAGRRMFTVTAVTKLIELAHLALQERDAAKHNLAAIRRRATRAVTAHQFTASSCPDHTDAEALAARLITGYAIQAAAQAALTAHKQTLDQMAPPDMNLTSSWYAVAEAAITAATREANN